MKKLKHLLLVGLLFVGISTAQAQLDRSHWGIKVGMDVSDMGGKIKSTKAKVGYQFGLTYDYQLYKGFYLQSGLDFTNKGFTQKHKYMPTTGLPDAKFSMNAMYLQLPIYAAYKIDVAPGTRIVFNAGPYMACGVGGKMKYERKVSGYEQLDQRSAFGHQGLKRFDVGLGMGVAAELSGLVFQFSYELGLRDLNKGNNIQLPGSMKNRNAVFTVGFKM